MRSRLSLAAIVVGTATISVVTAQHDQNLFAWTITEIPKYATRCGYVETERLARDGLSYAGRIKVGDPIFRFKLGVVSTADGRITWVDHGQWTD